MPECFYGLISNQFLTTCFLIQTFIVLSAHLFINLYWFTTKLFRNLKFWVTRYIWSFPTSSLVFWVQGAGCRKLFNLYMMARNCYLYLFLSLRQILWSWPWRQWDISHLHSFLKVTGVSCRGLSMEKAGGGIDFDTS